MSAYHGMRACLQGDWREPTGNWFAPWVAQLMRRQLAKKGRVPASKDAQGVMKWRDSGGFGRRISLGNKLMDGYEPLDDVYWARECPEDD